MKAIKGSLIHQILNDGTLFGGDYDGRLGHLTHWIHELDIFKGARVLDLGSNAGHFPIEYIRAGAKSVTAVEGRPEFCDQWNLLKQRIPYIDIGQIKWNTEDVKKYVASEHHDILTCMGLVYHMADPWTPLTRLATQDIQSILLESEFWLENGIGRETHEGEGTERTLGLDVGEVIEFWTLNKLEELIVSHFFSEWEIRRITIGGHVSGKTTRLNDKGLLHITLAPRGLWVLQR